MKKILIALAISLLLLLLFTGCSSGSSTSTITSGSSSTSGSDIYQGFGSNIDTTPLTTTIPNVSANDPLTIQLKLTQLNNNSVTASIKDPNNNVIWSNTYTNDQTINTTIKPSLAGTYTFSIQGHNSTGIYYCVISQNM